MNSWTNEVILTLLQEDDLLLKFYSETVSFKKWKQISDKLLALGIEKSVYQCRERYINKLDPQIKTERWSKEEIRSLFSFYNINGSKWQKLQSLLPSRTQVQLKNKFYSFLRSFFIRASQHQKLTRKIKINNIKSYHIKKIFEGKQEFECMKGKIFEFLQIMNFQIEQEKIQQLINLKENDFKQLFEIIQRNLKHKRLRQTEQNVCPQECQNNTPDSKSMQDLSEPVILSGQENLSNCTQKMFNNRLKNSIDVDPKKLVSNELKMTVGINNLPNCELQIAKNQMDWSEHGFQSISPYWYYYNVNHGNNIIFLTEHNENYFQTYNPYWNAFLYFTPF